MAIFRKAEEIADGGSVLNFNIYFYGRKQVNQMYLSVNKETWWLSEFDMLTLKHCQDSCNKLTHNIINAVYGLFHLTIGCFKLQLCGISFDLYQLNISGYKGCYDLSETK